MLLLNTVANTDVDTNWFNAIFGQNVDGLSDLQIGCYIVYQALCEDDVDVLKAVRKSSVIEGIVTVADTNRDVGTQVLYARTEVRPEPLALVLQLVLNGERHTQFARLIKIEASVELTIVIEYSIDGFVAQPGLDAETAGELHP